MISSKVIIKKNHLWKNENIIKTIRIPSEKNVCVHLLFAAVGLRRTVCFNDGFSENMGQDITRILQWIDEYNIANLYFDNNRTLTIIPNGYRLTDLTSASFSRASIGIAGNILLTYGTVRCIELGGCQFTNRPIDLHLNLLVALGGHTDDGETYQLKKDWNNCNEEFEFDCRTKNGISSVGVTIHAVVSCCALPAHIRCKLTYVTLESSVQTVIALATQYRPIVVSSSERIILFERHNQLPANDLILKHLPIDQIYLFTVCSLAAMLQFKLVISNFEYDQCITEYLKSIMSVIIDETSQNALFDGTDSFNHNQTVKHKLICDIYPDGLPTDISPVLTALFIARHIPFELIDRIYDIRNSQCKEFSKLGYETITNDNQIVYNGVKHEKLKDCHNLYAHDIRSGVAVLLLALYHINTDQWNEDDEIIIHQYEQVERGYGSLLHQKLWEFGFDIQFIRETSSESKDK
jgi:UDP-N-acetylglucosamine enolpyruvyl transferase